MSRDITENTKEKWSKLAGLLVFLTREGGIFWKSSVNDDEFLTSIGDNVVMISKDEVRRNSEVVPIVVITISSRTGETVDSFNDEDISDVNPNAYQSLSDLMTDIARSISGADEILDTIISKLEEKREIPF